MIMILGLKGLQELTAGYNKISVTPQRKELFVYIYIMSYMASSYSWRLFQS